MSAERAQYYGLVAEFETQEGVLNAAERVHESGYTRVDAYTPFPVHGLSEAIGYKKTRVPLVTLIGGIIGAIAGYFLQYWIHNINYPLNVGGRPYHSAPAFIPVAFECTILVAALSAVFGMLLMNGLPRPYHPIFNAPNFALASRDRFFLCIESDDPKFNPEDTRRFLESLGPREVTEVER